MLFCNLAVFLMHCKPNPLFNLPTPSAPCKGELSLSLIICAKFSVITLSDNYSTLHLRAAFLPLPGGWGVLYFSKST
jgi:hypothetical protein